MAHKNEHITEAQALTDINAILSTANGKAKTTAAPSAALPRLSNRLAELQEEIENEDNLTAKQVLETERDDIYDALKKVDEVLGKLTEQEATQILTPPVATFAGAPVGGAAAAQKASQIRDRIKKQADADSAKAAAAVQADEFEEVDPEELDTQVIRSAYQSFLLYNNEFFADYHNSLLNTGSPGTGYKAPAPAPSTPGSKNILQTMGYSKKKNSEPRVFFLTDDTDSSIVNNKLSLCPGNEKFIKIRNSEYATLQPLLRIFKTYRTGGGTPSKKVEFEFRNRTGTEGIDSFVNIPQPVGTALIGSRTKGVECGVKSFNWTFQGSDPYTATRDIVATLVLHAQHFSALSKERQGTDLIGPPVGPPAPVNYKYLDLIIQPDCNQTGSSGTTGRYSSYYDPGCYEIQVDVGYAQQNGPLYDAICCQYDSLFLVHVDHKIDFQDDGTLELTINYRGRLETLINDKKFNVLLPGGGFANVRKPSGAAGNALYTYNKIEDELQKERNPATGKPNKARIKELERLRESVTLTLRQYNFALILETMEDNNMIHTFPITNDEFLRFTRWKEPKYVGALPDRLGIGSTRKPTSGAENNVGIQLQKANEADVIDDKKDAVQETMKRITELTDAQTEQRLQEAVELQRHEISFIYLGDLLSIVLANTLGEIDMPNILSKTSDDGSGWLTDVAQVAQDVDPSAPPQNISSTITNPIVDNFHLVLGNIEITDAKGNAKQINLSHIPISLETFQDFMLKNVISQDTDYYSLLDFFDDLIGEVVTDMFSDQHIVGLVEADSRLSSTIFTSKTPLQASSLFSIVGNNYSELEASKITPTNLPFGKNSRCIDRSGDPYQYLVLNTMNSFPKNLAGTLVPGVRGDNIGDSNRGILHFTYGEDRGLLKSVKFAKTDQEYVPESRYASSDGSLLNQLSSVYDATFNMVGNNIFKPGMLLYFNAEPMGVGAPWQLRVQNGVVTDRSWANIMGIGGYYLIIEVASNIEPGVFDTTLKTRWVTSGEDGTPTPPPPPTSP